MQMTSGKKLPRRNHSSGGSLPQGNRYCSGKIPALVENTNTDWKEAESYSLHSVWTHIFLGDTWSGLKGSGAVSPVSCPLKIGQSQRTLPLVPHRKLPAIIIDHPLEGDNHICLGSMSVPQTPRHIAKS